MELIILRRPLSGLRTSTKSSLLALNASSKRQESSYRRSRSRLNVKPDASFTAKGPSQDHIIFNPPSSAPSVLNTPLKFLPKTDPRAKLLRQTAEMHADYDKTPAPRPQKPNAFTPAGVNLPPHFKAHRAEITGPKIASKVLLPAEIKKIQQLRMQDPNKYTTTALSKMYGCSQEFVSMCVAQLTTDPTPRKDMMKAKFAVIEDRWGPRRRRANEERGRRLDAALRDE